MKTLLTLAAALALLMPASAQDPSPAEQLGWTLAVHSYTFQKFSIFEAIDKAAAVGVKHMSISGSVNLPDADGNIVKSSTIRMTTNEVAALTARMKAQGIEPVFVNMGVVKPGLDETESRKIFEGAKRLGITVLVAEPELHDNPAELGPVMDVVVKLAKEYDLKVAICIEYEHNWENSSPEIAQSVEWFNATCAELVRPNK